jgi:ABC-type amino acid transport substrate-binding protein
VTPSARENGAERVVRTGTLRVGYVISPPSCYKDLQTKNLAGYSVDVLNEMGKRLGVKVAWVEEATWATMIEGLNTGRYDVIGSTSWRNSTRGKVADFVTPIVYSGVGVYVRPNDHRFDRKLPAINAPAVRIATMDGELSDAIAKVDYPAAQRVSLPQLSDVSQLLEEVRGGKADVSLMENNTAYHYLKQNPGAVRNIVSDRPVRVFGESFIVRAGDMRLQHTLDSAAEELLNEGFVDHVISKYEEGPGGKYRVALPYRSADHQ